MAQLEFPDDVKRRLVDGALAALNALDAKGGEPDRRELRYLAGAVSNMEVGAYAHAIQQLTLSAKRLTESDAAAATEAAESEVPQENSIGALRRRLRAIKDALK